MTDQKGKEDKISDITDDKELNEKDLQDVDGGVLRSPMTFSSAKDNCGGKCAGTIKSAVGSELDI